MSYIINGPVTIGETDTTITNLQGTGIRFTETLTAAGDILYASDANGTVTRLGVGTSGQVLTADGTPLPSWADPVSLDDRSLSVAMDNGLTDYVAVATATEVELGAPVSTAWSETTKGRHDEDGLFTPSGAGAGRITLNATGKYKFEAIVEWTGDLSAVNATSGNTRVTGGLRQIRLNQDPGAAGAGPTEYLRVVEQSNARAAAPFIQQLSCSVDVTTLATGQGVFSLSAEQNSGSTQDVRVLRFSCHRFNST